MDGGAALAADLAGRVDALLTRRARVLVAVDGPDAAGKTVLADRLAAAAGGPVVRASVDDFLRPRAERALLDAEGYYRSAFDVAALVDVLLAPFAAGAARVRVAVRDHVADRTSDLTVDVAERAALVVDGVFLLRPELRSRWTTSVHLTVPPSVTLARAAVRDRALLGDDLERRYRERYLPAQAAYARCRPAESADVVVDNTELDRPVVLRDAAVVAEDVQRYVDAIPPEHRPLFDRVQALVLAAAPQAEVRLSYGMPTYVVGDRRLHVGTWRHGVSLYGWSEGRDGGLLARRPELRSGKGTIRLRPEDDVADGELAALVRGTLGV